MIEAYEIGITLALDNGVASGIAAIRQDLDTLDRAVAKSSAGLLALHRLSDGLAISTKAYTSFPRPAPALRLAATETPGDENTLRSEALVIAPKPLPTPSSTAGNEPPPSVPPSGIAPDLLSQSPRVKTAAPAVPSASAPFQIATSATPLAPSPKQIAVPAAPPVSPPVTPVATTIADSPLPSTRPHAPLAASSPVALASLSQPPARESTPILFPELKPTPTPPPITQRTTASPTSERIHRSAAAPMAAPPPPSPSPGSSPDFRFNPPPMRHAAPAAPASRPAGPDRPETLSPPAAPASSSGPAQHRATTAPHGEIILDGARLGRWMSDRLARAADRPQSGTTGFDPRISPSYAGAPNGS